MAQYMAEDFRNLVNKLEEYMLFAEEGESVPNTSSQSVDKLLTAPAGLQKVASNLDVGALIQILTIPGNMRSDFKAAITALESGTPTLTTAQSLALATAFNHLLALNVAGKGQAINDIKTVGTPPVSEAVADIDNSLPSIDTLNDAITLASDTSPVAKLQATILVKYLTAGIHGKHEAGGVSHVLSGIINAINTAKLGKKNDALTCIASMVNHVEGDDHAIDSDIFPKIVVSLMLLVGDILQHHR